jgi:hypothetical protein
MFGDCVSASNAVSSSLSKTSRTGLIATFAAPVLSAREIIFKPCLKSSKLENDNGVITASSPFRTFFT